MLRNNAQRVSEHSEKERQKQMVQATEQNDCAKKTGCTLTTTNYNKRLHRLIHVCVETHSGAFL